MAHFKIFVATSVGLSFLFGRYAPIFLPFKSLGVSALAIFAIQTFAWLAWRCILYPKMFSPLRDLPKPPVSSKQVGVVNAEY